jgi:hypothetical protein
MDQEKEDSSIYRTTVFIATYCFVINKNTRKSNFIFPVLGICHKEYRRIILKLVLLPVSRYLL